MTDLQTYLNKIKELEGKATRLPLILNRYDGGGGRCFKKEPLTLVCDFYHQEDRELFFKLRNIAAELVEVALAADKTNKHDTECLGKICGNYKDCDCGFSEIETKLNALKNKIAGLGEG